MLKADSRTQCENVVKMCLLGWRQPTGPLFDFHSSGFWKESQSCPNSATGGGKKALHFAVLSLLGQYQHLDCQFLLGTEPSGLCLRILRLLGTVDLKSWQAWIVASVCLLKKYEEQMTAGVFFVKRSSQGHSVDFERCPQVSLSKENLWVLIIHFTRVETL